MIHLYDPFTRVWFIYASRSLASPPPALEMYYYEEGSRIGDESPCIYLPMLCLCYGLRLMCFDYWRIRQ